MYYEYDFLCWFFSELRCLVVFFSFLFLFLQPILRNYPCSFMSMFDGYAGAICARHKVLYILAGVGCWGVCSFFPLVLLFLSRLLLEAFFFLLPLLDWDQGAVWGLGVG